MKPYHILALAVLALLLARPPLTASAHGRTQVGDYDLVIGFSTEPALQGEPNGLDLRVTHAPTGEPVEGLEATLRVEIVYGAARKELPLEPRFGEPGAYTAHVLPTAPGDYTWHLFGTIRDTPVDVSMTSSPDTFGSVEPKSVVSFPGAEPTGAELAGATADATRLSWIALAAGAAGLLLGLAALLLALRAGRRPATHRAPSA